jgi:hypothetical protein
MKDYNPTLFANEPTLSATSPQTAMWAHIQCIQSLECLPVRNKSGSPSIQTHSVRFIGSYPRIKDWGKGPFSPDTGGAVAIRARPGDEANPPPGKRLLDWQRMWVQRAVCGLVALNVGSLAAIVSPGLPLLAPNVSPKHPLFAGPGAAVCRPLHLVIVLSELHARFVNWCGAQGNKVLHGSLLAKELSLHAFSKQFRERNKGTRNYRSLYREGTGILRKSVGTAFVRAAVRFQ